jgi:hypothetical protein
MVGLATGDRMTDCFIACQPNGAHPGISSS